MSSYKTILVAHDFSEHARAAVTFAAGLAKAFGATVHLVHVLPRNVEILSPYQMKLPAPIVRELQEEARKRLAPALEELRRAGVAGEAHLREGEPARAIADEAERLGADLLVMGRRGLTGLKHVLFGSVAERTHRIAPCPVLSVHAGA